jgi:photosystem II stability/assembly factor-like uncharacterized protein
MRQIFMFVLSLTLLFTTQTYGQFFWAQRSSGTTATLFGLSAGSPTLIVAVGDSGTIVRSTDSGLTWSPQSSPTPKRLWAVSFSDENNGTAVGDSGIVIRTTNGGTSWGFQASGTTDILTGVSFSDANRGTAVSAGGLIRRTTNGGSTWAPQTSNPTASFSGVFFIDSTHGFAVAAAGIVRSTTDGGTNWTPLLPGTVHPFRAVHFTDRNTGLVVGGTSGPIAYRTTNGGSNWNVVNLSTAGLSQQITALFFTDSSNGLVTALSGNIWRTANAGVSWNKEVNGVPLTPHYYSVTYLDQSTVIAVGSGGTILRGVFRGPQQMYATVPVSGNNTQVWGINATPSYSAMLIGTFGGVRAGSGLDFHPTSGQLFASTGFGGGTGGKLYTVDTLSGFASLIGPTGYPAVPGLAFAPNGSLFGAAAATVENYSNILIRINRNNGAGTLVGEFGTLGADTIQGLDGIAFHPLTGILYAGSGAATDGNSGHFFTIDTTTGAATHLGYLREVGTGDTLPNTLAGLTFDQTGTCYGSLGGGDGRIVKVYIDSLRFEYIGIIQNSFASGNLSVSDIAHVRRTTVNVPEEIGGLPGTFALSQNYPNPFNPSTRIQFAVARPGLVTLKVFNVLGQEVATLVDREMEPGSHEIDWRPTGLASGVYLYRLQASGFSEARKLLLLR